MHLQAMKTLSLQTGYLLAHAVAGNTLLLLGKPKQLFALDTTTYTLCYRQELSGSDSHSGLVAQQDVYFINRWLDKQYVVFAHAVADGTVLWHSALPIQTKAICKVLMHITNAGLLIIIQKNVFLLDIASGALFQQNELAAKISDISVDKEHIYLHLLQGCGRLNANLDYESLSNESFLQLCATGGQLYYVLRSGRGFGVFTEKGMHTLPDLGKVEHISTAGDEHLALRIKNKSRLALFNSKSEKSTWTPTFKVEEKERPDGFELYSVTAVKDGLVVVMYSIGSDEEVGFYYHLASQKIVPCFGRVKAKYLTVGDDVVQCGRQEISIYRVGE